MAFDVISIGAGSGRGPNPGADIINAKLIVRSNTTLVCTYAQLQKRNRAKLKEMCETGTSQGGAAINAAFAR